LHVFIYLLCYNSLNLQLVDFYSDSNVAHHDHRKAKVDQLSYYSIHELITQIACLSYDCQCWLL